MNPLARFIAALLSVIVLVASLFIGAVVALVALGFVAVAWAIALWRTRGIRRQWRREQQDAEPDRTTVEGDYRVVHDEHERERDDR